MTASTIERSPRSASQRPSRFTSACLRYAARGFVVAGLAGAAWLLSSSAAHASDAQDGGPSSSPVTGLVSVLTGEPSGNGLLTGILPVDIKAATGVSVPAKAPAKQQTRYDSSAEADGDLTRTVQGLLSPVLQPVTRTVAPVLRTPSKKPAPTAAVRSGARRTTDRTAGPHHGISTGTATVIANDGAHTGTGTGVAAHQRHDTPKRRTTTATAPVTAQATDAGRTNHAGADHVPAQPRPAPLPAYPATGTSGAPAVGSGLHQDGGANAVVTAASVTGEVAAVRPDAAAGVEVRPQRAGSPTVSPD